MSENKVTNDTAENKPKELTEAELKDAEGGALSKTLNTISKVKFNQPVVTGFNQDLSGWDTMAPTFNADLAGFNKEI